MSFEIICNSCESVLEANEEDYGKVLTCPNCNNLIKAKPTNDYVVQKVPVTFGTMFSQDKFGFSGDGQLSLHYDGIVYVGSKSWNPVLILFVMCGFFLIAMVTKIKSIFFLGSFAAIAFCKYEAKLVIPNEEIKNVKIDGDKITFLGRENSSVGWKQGVIVARTKDKANFIYNDLLDRG